MCWKMLRALLLSVAVWASLQQLQLTVIALCVHDSGNQKGAIILNLAHSKGNCRNLFSVWDLYEFAGNKMTPCTSDPRKCHFVQQPVKSEPSHLPGAALWGRCFGLSSGFPVLWHNLPTLADLTSSKGLTGLLSTRGHLILWKNSWGALLNSLSLWDPVSVCLPLLELPEKSTSPKKCICRASSSSSFWITESLMLEKTSKIIKSNN